jgi:opacity protein-like surface antigen
MNGRNVFLGVMCGLLVSGTGVILLPSSSLAQRSTYEEQSAREAEAERTRELERREAERTRAYERRRYDHDRPGEFYVAGFGGYTIGHGLNDVEGTGLASGLSLGDLGLKNSGVYGAKIGYFLPNRLNWLGLEVEAFNTTPHVEQTSFSPGAHLRVTTVAFNAVARAKMLCGARRDADSRRTSADPAYRDPAYRDDDFCRLQPYIGAGVGVFFARASNGTSSSDNGVPGLNALAGVRYFFTEHVALFGEYKYNRATFEFENIGGSGAGLKGDYSVSHIVGGLSFHF